MQQAIRKLYTKIGPFNVNIVQHLNKTLFPQPLRNITIFQKSCKKNHKFNQSTSEQNTWDTQEKITFAGYCLLSVPLAAFILGTWQIQRYQWKLSLIEKLTNRINQKPIELLTNLEDLASKEYCPVKVKGTFLYDKEFPIGYRSLIQDGKPVQDKDVMKKHETKRGYHIITPFKLADQDLTILVNRGWIPRSLKNPRHRQENKIEGETEIVGVLRLNENRPPFVPKNKYHADIWYYRDVNAMAEKVNASPIYIEMISNNSAQQYPIPGQTKVELRNEHLSYILTWYCLCGATGYMWYYKFIKGLALIH